jgi:glyoxylase-like metal-dependent hydrolase (beta-lactamase superfamily II)
MTISRGDSMPRFSYVARMPDKPGSMHQAAEIVKRHEGNLERIHYDRRIDAHTVFFEVVCSEPAYRRINEELNGIGFLQTSLAPLSFLKFHVYLENKAGELFHFLNHTTSAGANIAFMDFDDRSESPDRLTVSLTLENASAVEALLDQLKSRYRLEIIEYDTTGMHLDDTVFYIRFAQELRSLIGEREDQFLMKLLHDVNHIVQSLTNLGEDYRQVFESILRTGRTLRETTDQNFYADVQRVLLSRGAELLCFQMPCGGNVFILRAGNETVMFDTGFGIYHDDVAGMLRSYGIEDPQLIRRAFLTHADADHAGAAGFFPAVAHMHPGTVEILQQTNRAYGSKSQGSVLEEVYTHLINLFSEFNPPQRSEVFDVRPKSRHVCFDEIDEFLVGHLHFKVLSGLDGHVHGQVYYLCEAEGLLFTGDSLINFSSFTKEMEEFSTLAKILMTTVNVDSEAAKKERKGLLELGAILDSDLRKEGKRCLVCGGHGAISILEEGKLVSLGQVERYSRNTK